jgi:hypothetical protein
MFHHEMAKAYNDYYPAVQTKMLTKVALCFIFVPGYMQRIRPLKNPQKITNLSYKNMII